MTGIVATGFSVESEDGELFSLEAELRRLADLGVDTIELALGSVDLIAGGRIIPERLDRLIALTGQFDFTYTVHGLVSSNFMDPATAPYQLAVARALVEVCNRLEAGILVQHGGHLRAEQIAERAHADIREREALTELAEFAQRHGVRIALENIFSTAPGQYRQTPAEIAATVQAIDHPNVVALIDFGHAYIESTYKGLSFYEQIAAMAPVAGHLHVHDGFGRPQGSYVPYHPPENTAMGIGDLHLPLGWGDIDWDHIFGGLQCLPGTIMMMEIGRRYGSEQPESLRRARQLAGLDRAKPMAAQ